MLGDVQETVYVVEEDDDGEETVKVGVFQSMTFLNSDTCMQTIHKKSEMLFVRGMAILSPLPALRCCFAHAD